MPQYVELNFPDKKTEPAPGGFSRWSVWSCGFRPFFLGGAVLAALSIAAWLVVFFTDVSAGGPMGPIHWHAHEMIFGFTPAIIAGFLLTAVPKWTRVPGVTGGLLAAIFALWFAGRVAMAISGVLSYEVAALVDFLFLPALATVIAIPIVRARTPRNFGFIPLLFGLAAANAVFHLDHLNVIADGASRALDAGLAIIVVIIAIVGGRVIPFFTVNRIGQGTVERRRPVDMAVIFFSVAWLVALIIAPYHLVTGVIAIAAGVANLGRMYGWHSRHTFSVPLLWVLHVGYAFIGLGLLFFGLAILDITGSRSVAIHALTAGAIGILCLGMMARVSLGHSGRPLKAHRLTTIAFIAISAAALLRVIVPWVFPAAYSASIISSGVLWTAAWLLFVIVYAPILLTPRADGKPG